MVLRGLCDFVLSGAADAYYIAYAIASLIDAIEHTQANPPEPDRSKH